MTNLTQEIESKVDAPIQEQAAEQLSTASYTLDDMTDIHVPIVSESARIEEGSKVARSMAIAYAVLTHEDVLNQVKGIVCGDALDHKHGVTMGLWFKNAISLPSHEFDALIQRVYSHGSIAESSKDAGRAKLSRLTCALYAPFPESLVPNRNNDTPALMKARKWIQRAEAYKKEIGTATPSIGDKKTFCEMFFNATDAERQMLLSVARKSIPDKIDSWLKVDTAGLNALDRYVVEREAANLTFAKLLNPKPQTS